MSIEEITTNALNGEYDLAIEELRKLSPDKMNDFYICIKSQKRDLFDDFLDKLSEEQYKKFKYLESSERQRKYLLSKPYEELSEQELADLRACDF